jgi:hypothetical protein
MKYVKKMNITAKVSHCHAALATSAQQSIKTTYSAAELKRSSAAGM